MPRFSVLGLRVRLWLAGCRCLAGLPTGSWLRQSPYFRKQEIAPRQDPFRANNPQIAPESDARSAEKPRTLHYNCCLRYLLSFSASNPTQARHVIHRFATIWVNAHQGSGNGGAGAACAGADGAKEVRLYRLIPAA